MKKLITYSFTAAFAISTLIPAVSFAKGKPAFTPNQTSSTTPKTTLISKHNSVNQSAVATCVKAAVSQRKTALNTAHSNYKAALKAVAKGKAGQTARKAASASYKTAMKAAQQTFAAALKSCNPSETETQTTPSTTTTASNTTTTTSYSSQQ